MSIIVYYLLPDRTPRIIEYTDTEMSEALTKCQALRAEGFSHVTMVSQLEGQVGGMGVSGITDGKLPSGDDYSWSKSHRAGAKAQKEIIKK